MRASRAVAINKTMSTVCKSPLKWAGGKHKLLDEVYGMCGGCLGVFHDVFAGSGVVGANAVSARKVINDVNPHLVAFLKEVKRDPDAVIEEASRIWENTSENYYHQRDRLNSGAVKGSAAAAVFLYLNRHGFNGLCRYNSSGGFNVPFGTYATVQLPRATLVEFSSRLSKAKITCGGFEKVIDSASAGDVVYCDPPYAPLNSASFTDYFGGFGRPEQEALKNACVRASKRGAVVVISNSDTEYTRELYSDADQIKKLSVSRTIASSASGRKKAGELLVRYGEKHGNS